MKDANSHKYKSLQLYINYIIDYDCFYILMPHNMIIINFRLPNFQVSKIMLYFLHSTSVLSFYIDVVLTLSIEVAHANKNTEKHRPHIIVSWPNPKQR